MVRDLIVVGGRVVERMGMRWVLELGGGGGEGERMDTLMGGFAWTYRRGLLCVRAPDGGTYVVSSGSQYATFKVCKPLAQKKKP